MPYKNKEDKAKHNKLYLARVKSQPLFKAKQRLRQKLWCKKNPDKVVNYNKRRLEYKKTIGYSALNKKYRSGKFNKRQQLRFLLESCSVWKIVDRFAKESRIISYAKRQLSNNRRYKIAKAVSSIRRHWAIEEIKCESQIYKKAA